MTFAVTNDTKKYDQYMVTWLNLSETMAVVSSNPTLQIEMPQFWYKYFGLFFFFFTG